MDDDFDAAEYVIQLLQCCSIVCSNTIHLKRVFTFPNSLGGDAYEEEMDDGRNIFDEEGEEGMEEDGDLVGMYSYPPCSYRTLKPFILVADLTSPLYPLDNY